MASHSELTRKRPLEEDMVPFDIVSAGPHLSSPCGPLTPPGSSTLSLTSDDSPSSKRRRLTSNRSKREPWMAGEDAGLSDLVMAWGTSSWRNVADALNGKYHNSRTAKHCRERWISHVDPNIRKGGWAEEEDHVIVARQISWGNCWADIARCLKGRTVHDVKNRYFQLSRIAHRHPFCLLATDCNDPQQAHHLRLNSVIYYLYNHTAKGIPGMCGDLGMAEGGISHHGDTGFTDDTYRQRVIEVDDSDHRQSDLNSQALRPLENAASQRCIDSVSFNLPPTNTSGEYNRQPAVSSYSPYTRPESASTPALPPSSEYALQRENHRMTIPTWASPGGLVPPPAHDDSISQPPPLSVSPTSDRRQVEEHNREVFSPGRLLVSPPMPDTSSTPAEDFKRLSWLVPDPERPDTIDPNAATDTSCRPFYRHHPSPQSPHYMNSSQNAEVSRGIEFAAPQRAYYGESTLSRARKCRTSFVIDTEK